MSGTLDDKDMWQYALQQDLHMITEFGLGIVGIGALFVAYTSADPVKFPGLQGIIAVIGLAGSLIIFCHIVETGLDFWNFKKTLTATNRCFFYRFDKSRGQLRNFSFGKLFRCFPITLLMGYFMFMVALAWIVLLIDLPAFGVTLSPLFLVYISIVVFVMFAIVYNLKIREL
ncbi:MAG: hypothetical protein WAK45_08790 [Methanoregula sp.]|uniref:hypothetical protein n=1 Tax=Methanoregula sp. TaxID=2052170 RepID=UPI003BB01C5B